MVAGFVSGFAAALWLAAAPAAVTAPIDLPPVRPENLAVIGMQPTEVVEWSLLQQTTGQGAPLVVAFAKASTSEGETVLDEVLATKHSIGIYAFRPESDRWLPIWEVVTGEMEVAFVEGYDILDVNGDGSKDVCVRIRYYGEGRALDYKVLSLGNGRIQELFVQKSIYHGSVTAATGYIVIEYPSREQRDVHFTTVYALSQDGHSFEKIRETKNRATP